MPRQLWLETDEGRVPLTWKQFLDNNDGFTRKELLDICYHLNTHGVYKGGGGAEPEWSLFWQS